MNPLVDAVSQQAEGRDAKTGQFLPLNKAAEVHGVVTAERRGLTPEMVRTLAEFRSAVLADLGGAENLSAIERAYVESLVSTASIIEMLAAYLRANGPLTARGRQRTSVATMLAAISTFDKLSARLGLERRKKPASLTTIEDYMNSREAERDE
jgi:hypothetical protein